jgi:hypothetical protein
MESSKMSLDGGTCENAFSLTKPKNKKINVKISLTIPLWEIFNL